MWFNPIMAWILRSPLHGMLSGNTLLITYTGRRSGKTFSTPVNYLMDGETLLTTSSRERAWWRNLRGGAPVTLHLRGRSVKAFASAVEDESQVAEMLGRFVRLSPNMAKFLNVHLNASGEPNLADLLTAARERVMIRTTLAE